ncbi:uncharacterized protein LOC103514170 isoform X1 [Diaphorina citri]|uniref:Uncharacterized protein LOC103514170 isoform X1 n=1 Tax=Diaphorina citri TaxID=121845 RepID=A0A3Q0J3K9_DIACI|nr:uncharacterized protein LOC103514170 isoform X1 [Diaphorina citri]
MCRGKQNLPHALYNTMQHPTYRLGMKQPMYELATNHRDATKKQHGSKHHGFKHIKDTKYQQKANHSNRLGQNHHTLGSKKQQESNHSNDFVPKHRNGSKKYHNVPKHLTFERDLPWIEDDKVLKNLFKILSKKKAKNFHHGQNHWGRWNADFDFGKKMAKGYKRFPKQLIHGKKN